MRTIRKPRVLRSCWKGEGALFSARAEAALPNTVEPPVAATRAVASPVWATEPRNRAFVASAGEAAATAPGCLSTG